MTEAHDGEVLTARMRLYRNGVCEFAYRSPRDEHRAIPSRTFLEYAHDALAYFASVYERAGYHGRLRVWTGVEDAETSILMVNNYERPHGKTNLDSVVTWTDTNTETLLADPLPLVHGAMDDVWQAYGYDRCWLFDDQGNYAFE